MNGKKTSKLQLNRTTLQQLNPSDLVVARGAAVVYYGKSNPPPCRPTNIDTGLACVI